MGTTRNIFIFGIVGIVLAGAVYFAARKHSAPTDNGGAIAWTDFGAGSAAAGTAHKKIIIDVYTDWCTWCKTMDKKTYADEEVVSYVQEHFIPVRLNAESQVVRQVHNMQMTDAQLAGAFGVSGYPTTVFVNDDGTPITSMDGYIEAGEFKTVLRFIAEDKYRSMSFEEYKKSAN